MRERFIETAKIWLCLISLIALLLGLKFVSVTYELFGTLAHVKLVVGLGME